MVIRHCSSLLLGISITLSLKQDAVRQIRAEPLRMTTTQNTGFLHVWFFSQLLF